MKKTDKIPKRYFQVYDSIFKQRVHVLLNFTPEDYEKWLNKNKVKDVEVKNFNDFQGMSSDFETAEGKTERIIFIKMYDHTIRNNGTLIHEIVHVIIKIWSSNNIPFNADTQEFLAHSIANFYEDIACKLLK